MIVIFCLKFESIKSVNSLVDCIFVLFNLSIGFIYYVGVSFYFFFNKFHHQHPIFHRSLVKQDYRMGINSLVKYYILNLTSCFTDERSELIDEDKKKLKF